MLGSLPKYARATVDLFNKLYKPSIAATFIAVTAEVLMHSSKLSFAASAYSESHVSISFVKSKWNTLFC
jgi:hypothetical protein